MDLARRQIEFAAHLRDPARHPAPAGIEDRRMAVYRELFINNLTELLGGVFPVARRILGESGWLALVREFYAGHAAHTPYFLEVPREFVEWLAERTAGAGEPAFLAELAHYEWVELALSVSDAEQPGPAADPGGDLLEAHPVVSVLAWALAYRWPVHRLSPEFQPGAPPETPTCLVVYRDAGGEVGFLETTPMTHALLELLEQDPALSGRDALERLQPGATGDAVAGARAALEALRERGVILGTSNPAGDAA